MQKFVCIILVLFFVSFASAQEKHRVFVFTDINIDSGDPDDRQSLVHLLWYANELQIEGIVPERWKARSVEACELALDSYTKDYKAFGFNKYGYPNPGELKKKIAKDDTEVLELFAKAAGNNKSPLYVLIWGNMMTFNKAFYKNADLSDNIRIITIGTGTMLEKDYPHLPESWKKADLPCQQYNWNGNGRNDLFNDKQFTDLWWLEINWTYNGMFSGEEPKEMFHKLAEYGKMGQHIKEVVKNEDWAQYFRVGDTPSVLYVIDPNHDINDPEKSSWAGQFKKPFPQNRPNYYTDFCGNLNWDYSNPCNTWDIHEQVAQTAKQTLENRRDEMYRALLEKLTEIYKIK
jgi:hypothetical protein